jgi:hypothetical protein
MIQKPLRYAIDWPLAELTPHQSAIATAKLRIHAFLELQFGPQSFSQSQERPATFAPN